MKNVVETTQLYFGNDDVKFDSKWWLRCAFNNGVFDFKTHQFREYKYDDYISITTGYNWIEPPQENVDFLMRIYRMIQPKPEELECLLRAYSTGLEGRVLLYFIILNGRGQNGKTLMNNLMLACLGILGMTGNNALLTETRKIGPNPELANIDKRTFIIFEETKKDKKLENSNIRELTGGNGLSARKCYSNETEMTIHGTFMLACNNKPNMAGEIEVADMSRTLDIRFNSRFVKPELAHLVNEKKHIYLANEEFKTEEFRIKYRCAHMKIMMMTHQRYAKDGFNLQIPKSFMENTQAYLEKSSQVGEWFSENYKKIENYQKPEDKNKEKYIELSEAHEIFKESELYQSMSNAEKKKWTINLFIKYFIDNPFTSDLCSREKETETCKRYISGL